MRWLNRIMLGAAKTLCSVRQAMTMQELFDEVNAVGNVSRPAALQGPTMNIYTGGSMFMRVPNKTYQLASVTAPSWNAGCGGIDLYMGGISFINKEQFVAMLRNIGSNALGYSFKLAMQNLCPTCDNVMQALQATAQAANRLNIDSCEAARGIVNASLPDSLVRGKDAAARQYGTYLTNTFSDLTEAWTNVMGKEKETHDAISTAVKQDPSIKDRVPAGNIVWKSLKKMQGIDDNQREILMSMVGTVILPALDSDKTGTAPVILDGTGITLEMLMGEGQGATGQSTLPVWVCDKKGVEECMNPRLDTIKITGFRSMVRKKLDLVADKIANRSAYGDDEEPQILAFLNVTDLPVYKMLAVATSEGNTGMADMLMGRYEQLIAARYAQTYIERAVSDLRKALNHYSSVADAVQKAELDKLQGRLDMLVKKARETIQTAYSQTVSTYNITLEIQHIERALNANLSQTLRASLNFGKSLN